MKTFIPDKFVVTSIYDTSRETVTKSKDFYYLNDAIESFKWECNYCGSFSKWAVNLTAIDTENNISMIIDIETYDYLNN